MGFVKMERQAQVNYLLDLQNRVGDISLSEAREQLQSEQARSQNVYLEVSFQHGWSQDLAEEMYVALNNAGFTNVMIARSEQDYNNER